MPRLPPGTEPEYSGYFLPRWSRSSAAGDRRTPESLFPAGRGRTGDRVCARMWARERAGTNSTTAALWYTGITAIGIGWVGLGRQSQYELRGPGARFGCPLPPKAWVHTHLQQHAEDVPADDEQFSRGCCHCGHGSESGSRARVRRGLLVSESAARRNGGYLSPGGRALSTLRHLSAHARLGVVEKEG